MRLTFRAVNAALRESGYREVLVQGNGYLYFAEGEAASWFSSSIPVCRLNHLHTAEEVIGWRNHLA